jgi:hypothetical protein
MARILAKATNAKCQYLCIDTAADNRIIMLYCKKASLARGELRRLQGLGRGGNWKNLSTGVTARRTRGSGFTRTEEPTVVLSSDEEEEVEEVEENAQAPTPVVVVEEASTAKKKIIKPAHNRVMLEVDQIDKAIGNLACRECGEAVKVNVRTVCLASSIGLNVPMRTVALSSIQRLLPEQQYILPEGTTLKGAPTMPSMCFTF